MIHYVSLRDRKIYFSRRALSKSKIEHSLLRHWLREYALRSRLYVGECFERFMPRVLDAPYIQNRAGRGPDGFLDFGMCTRKRVFHLLRQDTGKNKLMCRDNMCSMTDLCLHLLLICNRFVLNLLMKMQMRPALRRTSYRIIFLAINNCRSNIILLDLYQ